MTTAIHDFETDVKNVSFTDDTDVDSHVGAETDGSLIADDLLDANCLQLNGSSEYAQKTVANYRSGDSSGTVSGWFKCTGAGSHNGQAIFSTRDTGSSRLIQIEYRFDTNAVRMNAHDNTTLDAIDFAAGELTENVWYHFAVVSNGTGYTGFINGVVATETVVSGSDRGHWFADITLRDNLALGRSPTAQNYFNGEIDLVEVYSVALTASEVQKLYQTGIRDQTPVNGWDMSEGSGTTVGDDFGSDDLTTQSGAWSTSEPAFYATRTKTTLNDLLI
jgi:hypothetical protein